MKRNIILISILILLVQTSCALLNKAHGELQYNNNVTKGQELLDLKKALDEGAINQKEFTKEDKQYDYLEWWQKSKKDKQQA